MVPSIVMIDQEMDLLYFFRKFFEEPGRPKFFTMTDPEIGVLTAATYNADLVVADIGFPKFDFYEGERLIEKLRKVRPEIKIMIYSTYGDEDTIYKYKTVFGVDAYLVKLAVSYEEALRKMFELIGQPFPCPT